MTELARPLVAPPPRPLPVGLVILLGMLTILAPLSIDFYLPALPTLSKNFGVGPGPAQLTLTSYFFGFAIGQAFYGPIVDRFGRKPPLYIGMVLFSIASFGCAAAPTINVLIALRFLQAIGACAGGVVSRAIVRDLFTPLEATRVYAALVLVTGLGPLLAPILGGYMLLALGWRSLFVLLGIVTLAILLVVHFRVKESQRPGPSVEARAQAFVFNRIIGRYVGLARDRHFSGYALCSAFALAGMFVYVSGAPFVFIELYHIPPQYFGWLFGSNAIIMILGSQINARVVDRYPAVKLLRYGNLAQAFAGCLLLVAGITGWGGIVGILVPLGLFTLCMGFIMANALVLAMAPFGPIAGMASALIGTFQFVTGAIMATLTSLVHTGTALPMTAGMAFCGLGGLFANRVIVIPRTEPATDI